jgi:hypothetical protein
MRLKKDQTTKQGMSKRFMLGFAALASAVVVGAAGFVGAQQSQPPASFCQQGNFKNHGQCVSAWKHLNQPGNGQGNGYGGGNGNEVSTDVDIEVDGDDNIVSVFINYVFGSAN